MLLEEYVEDYNFAPYELSEFADGARYVTDCPELKEAAIEYLAAKHALLNALLEAGVELG